MASVDFIQKRIDGKKAELDKLEKKLARIRKAEASGWANNPYCYGESDLRYTLKDIDRATTALASLTDELALTTKKDASRNVQVILDFIDAWKARCLVFYKESFPEYLKAYREWCDYDHAYCNWYNTSHSIATREEYKQKAKQYEETQTKFKAAWNFITPYINYSNKVYTLNEEKLVKDLTAEGKRKYDFIIDRTCAIVGTITDASNLYIGAKGDLNGYIIGTDGKASVRTIGAGGYRIQVFHYRTLIHKI